MSIDSLGLFSKKVEVENKIVTDKKGNKFLCMQSGSLKCCTPVFNIVDNQLS